MRLIKNLNQLKRKGPFESKSNNKWDNLKKCQRMGLKLPQFDGHRVTLAILNIPYSLSSAFQSL